MNTYSVLQVIHHFVHLYYAIFKVNLFCFPFLSLSIFSHSTHLYLSISPSQCFATACSLYASGCILAQRNRDPLPFSTKPSTASTPFLSLHLFSSNHINQSFPYLIYYPTHSNQFPVSEPVLHAISKKVIISQWLFTQVRLRNQNTVFKILSAVAGRADTAWSV